MAHFSASGDSIAPLFIVVRIGLDRVITIHYLAAFVRLPGPAICFCCKMLCFLSRLFVPRSVFKHCSFFESYAMR